MSWLLVDEQNVSGAAETERGQGSHYAGTLTGPYVCSRTPDMKRSTQYG